MGALGRKLAMMSGLTDDEYLRTFDRLNLIEFYPGDIFPNEPARRGAEILRRRLRGRSLILLGSGVARAFNLRISILRWIDFNGGRVAVLPHPSGRNRWYNDPRNRARASGFMRTVTQKVS